MKVHAIANKGYKELEKKDRFSRLKQLLWKLKLMKDVPQVDVCHVHSVYKTALVMVLQNRKKFKKLILSYWGSDILDKSQVTLNLQRRCLEIASAITVTVKQTLKLFRELHGSRYDDKIQVCRFATNGLDCIKELSEKVTRQDCRKSYHIPEDKICVTCGYNAAPAQHQDLCLKTLQELPEELRKKLYVIVPMQYGNTNQGYVDRVKAMASVCDFDCTVLEEYVPFEMSARLAVATDIYLHLRDTDAFSNALKEHVYADSRIIKGDWLVYTELEEMGAPVTSVGSFDLLEQTLVQVLENTVIQERITLFDPIYELYSTENIVAQWGNVIDSVLENKNG